MPLPTFIIIGAQKSGTTSLYHYLAQHPDIFMSAVKEPNFFAFEGQHVDFRGPGGRPAAVNAYSVTDLASYEALFAAAGDRAARGEASTLYMEVAGTPQRVRERIPDVRLVAILRNPVDRAYSSFLHCRRAGREPLADFDAALDLEQERIAAGWGFLWRYGTMGEYARQLRPWYDTFPREQLLVTRFDELVRDPHALFARILSHIGVDPHVALDSSEKHNVSGEPKNVRLQAFVESPNALKAVVKPLVPERVRGRLRSLVMRHNLTKPTMPATTRARLQERYEAEILALQELTGLDWSSWLGGGTRGE